MAAQEPLTLLIAALGGEGGGVLTNWIVGAAELSDLPVQATSIPGVAQRTGATTYYIEIWPEPRAAQDGPAPVLALSPAAGEVDVMLASELLEAGRAVRAGLVTPDRTLLIAAAHRVYTTAEKMAPADGRYDADTLVRAAKQRANECVLLDLAEIAQGVAAPLNAVLLGALAGSGRLPIAEDAFRDAIRAAGKAAETNLRGFEAGLAALRGKAAPLGAPARTWPDPQVAVGALMDRARADFPAAVQPVIGRALHRLADYQDSEYAALYLDRLARFRDADADLLDSLARRLAVRMSYEDVIRVAQAKLRPDRLARVRGETGAALGEPVLITEFLKPGLAEICDVLPRRLADVLLALGRGWPWFGRRQWSMQLRTTSLWGYARLALLARRRKRRRGTWRFHREQQAIEAWLDAVAAAGARDPHLAREIADCARLITGYGDTHRRGTEHYARIDAALIRPALTDGADPGAAAAAIAAARRAALADGDGTALEQVLGGVTLPKNAVPAPPARDRAHG